MLCQWEVEQLIWRLCANGEIRGVVSPKIVVIRVIDQFRSNMQSLNSDELSIENDAQSIYTPKSNTSILLCMKFWNIDREL